MWLSHDHTFYVGSLLISTDSAQASAFKGCISHPDISWYMVDIYINSIISLFKETCELSKVCLLHVYESLMQIDPRKFSILGFIFEGAFSFKWEILLATISEGRDVGLCPPTYSLKRSLRQYHVIHCPSLDPITSLSIIHCEIRLQLQSSH